MQTDHIAEWPTHEPSRTCVADGWGVAIRVRGGHLEVEDGIGRSRRTRRFHKATANLDRLVVVARDGYLTLEATRWLRDATITYVHLDREGLPLVTSSPTRRHQRLVRAQALAMTHPVGAELARWLIERKLAGQDWMLSAMAAGGDLSVPIGQLADASTLDEILLAEAAGAAEYWRAWADVPLTFTKSDRGQVPDHWHQFGARRSTISAAKRHAINPANAILNYLYGVLEAEARIVLRTAGLDPTLGILHADLVSRDSMASDLMEPVRPMVDKYFYELLATSVFRRKDFAETNRGGTRVRAPLSHHLAQTGPLWRVDLVSIAEQLAKRLTRAIDPRPTRAATRSGPETSGRTGRVTSAARKRKAPAVPRRCSQCGDVTQGTVTCGSCRSDARLDQLASFYGSAHEALREARDLGNDPAHGGEAGRKRGRAVSGWHAEARSWEAGNEAPDPSEFTDLLAALKNVPIAAIQDATGLSAGYCSQIRRGLRTPHPMHWSRLRAMLVARGTRTHD